MSDSVIANLKSVLALIVKSCSHCVRFFLNILDRGLCRPEQSQARNRFINSFIVALAD